MTSGETKGGMLNALRASADTALKRLAPSKGAPSASLPEAETDRPIFSDPTTALFPSGAAAEDEGEHALPLAMQLEQSAQAMARRKDELREPAQRLLARIEERRDGEVTLMTQALRVLIGLVWLGVAAWLYLEFLNARADGIGVIAGSVPLEDAQVLIRAFLIVAGAGLGVAFLVAALTRALGNADNGRIKREAEALGAAMADAATEFDETLSTLRGSMDKRGRPADAVDDLSRAHLTALEAHDFFREINFLTGEEDERARRMFKGFLSRAGVAGGGASFMDFVLVFALGLLGGAVMMHVAIAPEPEPVSDVKSVMAVASYPWAIKLIVLGGLLYALAGGVLSIFARPMTEGLAEKARADALTKLRSGFAARSALHPADITRRIKDAVDVFRARVGGTSRTASANHSNADFSAEASEPEWRRRDSSVKFVETGFAGAPQEWRTDAYAKKFEASGTGKTETKRGSKTP